MYFTLPVYLTSTNMVDNNHTFILSVSEANLKFMCQVFQRLHYASSIWVLSHKRVPRFPGNIDPTLNLILCVLGIQKRPHEGTPYTS